MSEHYTQDQLDAAVTAARAEATQAERSRIAGILDCAEAGPRRATARKLALMTDFSVADARSFMADLPVEKVAALTPPLAERAKEGAGFGGDGAASLETESGAGMAAAAAEASKARRAALNMARGFGPNKNGGDNTDH